MKVSHVGSFPKAVTVEKAFKDMVSIGVDVPPYPQIRGFIDIYLEPLVDINLLKRKGELYFADPKLLLESKPPTLEIPEAIQVSRLSAEMKVSNLRGPVTGPLTLASRVYREGERGGLESTILASKDVVVEFMVEYVRNAIKHLVDIGYNYIFVDEPILGNIVGAKRILYGYTEDDLVELYEKVYKGFPNIVKGIHVCGRIPPRLLNILVRIKPLNLLNHEFKDTPENLNSISREALENHDKILSPGIVSSKSLRVESLDETINLLQRLVENYGLERLDLVSADCGFGGLGVTTEAYEVAIKKLIVVRRAVDSVARCKGSG